METGPFFFAFGLIAVGVFLILQVKNSFEGAGQRDELRDRQRIAYEKRRSRMAADRVKKEEGGPERVP